MDGDAISLIIVDNGQIYIGEEGAGSAEASAMGEVVRWLKSSDSSISARRKLLVLTSSILVGESLVLVGLCWLKDSNIPKVTLVRR